MARFVCAVQTEHRVQHQSLLRKAVAPQRSHEHARRPAHGGGAPPVYGAVSGPVLSRMGRRRMSSEEPQTARPLRVGVIGAGVGTAHILGYNQLPGVEVRALADLNDERLQQVAAKYGVPETYHAYEELLAQPEIDAVSICLPNVLHAPVTIAALRAGKHVLVEKPLARTVAEGQAMLTTAQETGRILMVAFNQRYRSDMQWLKQYVDTGALGRIYYAKAHWMRRSGIPRLGSWFVSQAQAGGGPLIDLGVHVLDMALYLMGEPQPESVSASAYAEFGPRGQK